MATMTQFPHLVRRALRCKHNIKFLSQPAMGKTTALMKLVTELREEDPKFFFQVWDGGTMSPTDSVMTVPDMEAMVLRECRKANLPNAYNTPDLRGIIYVGEVALMGLETSRGFQKLWNHEDVGGFKIPDGVIFVGDGNRLSDKSGAKQESRANGSRFVTYPLEYDVNYALDVMKGYHERVAAFAIRNPQCIDNYDQVFNDPKLTENDLLVQEGKHGCWANLRSWNRVSNIMTDADETGIPVYPEEIQRNVGSGMEATFSAFCQLLDKLTTLEDIVRDPKAAEVPTKMDEQYALSTLLSLMAQKDNFVAISQYMQRFSEEIQVVFFRLMNERLFKAKDEHYSAIRSTREYKTWITAKHISRLLSGATTA